MKQERPPVTFEVRIEGYEDHTWRGKVMTRDGQVAAFSNELELLLTINGFLCGDGETPCRRNAPI